MSETIESTKPTEQQFKNRVADVDARSVTAELRCGECDDRTEAKVLPGESVDVTICRSCATDHLRTTGLI